MVTKIKIEDVENLQVACSKNFAPKIVNTIISELGTVFTYAVDKNIIVSNPAKKVIELDNLESKLF